MTLDFVLSKFLDTKKLAGLSDKSIVCYREFIGFFLDFVGRDTLLQDVSKNDIEAYLFSLYNRSISLSTRASYIRHLKVFVKWVEKQYSISLGSENIVVPKSPKKNIYIYSDDEIRLLFDSIHAPSYWLTLRNASIVVLMLDSGLRQSEVANVRYKYLKLDKGLLTVCGKGNKERTVKVGLTSKLLIKKYMNACPYDITDFLFLDKSGGHISNNTIKRFMFNLNRVLPFDVSCHKLRHNFATNYCLDQYNKYGSVDIFQLKALMGHEDVSTTERYLHIANEIIASNCSISHVDNIFNLKN